jgi:hypothetical protein
MTMSGPKTGGARLLNGPSIFAEPSALSVSRWEYTNSLPSRVERVFESCGFLNHERDLARVSPPPAERPSNGSASLTAQTHDV